MFSLHQFSLALPPLQPIFSRKKSGVPELVFLLQHLFQLHLVIFHDLLQDHSITKELQFLHFNVHFSYGSEQWKLDQSSGQCKQLFVISTWYQHGEGKFSRYIFKILRFEIFRWESFPYFYPSYVYIINLIPLHVFCLLLMGRYEHKLYVSYTTFYCIGQLMAMNIPFVGFQPIKTSEHMASAGVFALLQVWLGFSQRFSKIKIFRRMRFWITFEQDWVKKIPKKCFIFWSH